jgi:hypothetical protein
MRAPHLLALLLLSPLLPLDQNMLPHHMLPVCILPQRQLTQQHACMLASHVRTHLLALQIHP